MARKFYIVEKVKETASEVEDEMLRLADVGERYKLIEKVSGNAYLDAGCWCEFNETDARVYARWRYGMDRVADRDIRVLTDREYSSRERLGEIELAEEVVVTKIEDPDTYELRQHVVRTV